MQSRPRTVPGWHRVELRGEIRDPSLLLGQLGRIDLHSPPIFLISGTDIAIADSLLEQLKRRIQEEQGACETIFFTAEAGEEERLYEEIFNMALFSPYRLLILRQGAEILQPLLSRGGQQLWHSFKRHFVHLPDRLLLFIIYPGEAPAKLTQIFGKRLLHLKTRKLYPDQVGNAIMRTARRLHLTLSAEALYLLQEAVEPQQGSIENILSRLASLFGTERELGRAELRSLLYPAQGWDPFAIVDGLFSNSFPQVCSELRRFHPPQDSFFALLKLILNRVNEIRRASVGYELGMSDEELLLFLNLKRRPPFIQRKTLARLKREIPRFGQKRRERLYEFLIQMQQDFRSGTPVGQQSLHFQERISEMFFGRQPSGR